MSLAKIAREEIVESGNVFSSVLVETKNAYIILLSEDGDSLGTLAVSVPQKAGMLGPPLSSVLLGERNTTLARIFAERLATTLKKMVLVSVFLKTVDEREAGPILWKLVERVVKKGDLI